MFFGVGTKCLEFLIKMVTCVCDPIILPFLLTYAIKYSSDPLSLNRNITQWVRRLSIRNKDGEQLNVFISVSKVKT